jgi:DNA-binding NarL/FixJ family response regulator
MNHAPATPKKGDKSVTANERKSRDKHTMIRVMVVDDHSFARAGLCNLVGAVPGFTVCAEADSSESAFASIAEMSPDMCVIDISLPGVSGLELTRAILRTLPQCRILIVSAYDREEYTAVALGAGALGYVEKSASMDTLMAAVRAVGRGDCFFRGGDLGGPPATSAAGGKEDPPRPSAVLSARELEVFYLLGAGLSVQDIAVKLGSSARTVDKQRQSIRIKLHASSVTEVASLAVRWRQANESRLTTMVLPP